MVLRVHEKPKERVDVRVQKIAVDLVFFVVDDDLSFVHDQEGRRLA